MPRVCPDLDEVGRHVVDQYLVLGIRVNGGQADGFFDRQRQVELVLVQGKFAGLDALDIENFVDQFEQVTGGAVYVS